VIWLLASLLFLVGAAYSLWPLLRHWQPGSSKVARDRPLDAAEEVELDVAVGRLSEGEGTARRRQLRRDRDTPR